MKSNEVLYAHNTEMKDETPVEHIESLPMPEVIKVASEEFQLFTDAWNALYHKGFKIKSLKSLKALTDKIKEL
jgi:hypothetical protein